MSNASKPVPDRFTLGDWQVDVSLDEVAGHGHAHKPEPRSMRLLVALAHARGEVVRADDLLDTERPWHGPSTRPASGRWSSCWARCAKLGC
jgi:DNA-binding winged helix-turn-helix (wHTH) protein